MNGIQVKYAVLCTLSVEQLFYENKVCRQYKAQPIPDITFTPTPECRELMNRMDLVFRPADAKGGFTVLASVSGKTAGGDDLLRAAVKKGSKLTFLLQLKNPELLNFNDLPVQDASTQTYYCSNRLQDPAAPRDGLHISLQDTGVEAADILRTSPADYQYQHAAAVTPGAAVVKHLLTGATVAEKTVLNHAGGAILRFDLSALPSGLCQLWINHVETDTFYYPGAAVALPVFGVVELSLDAALDANYRIIEPDRSITGQRPHFRLRFRNRPTLWRYTISLQPNSPLFLEMAALSPAERSAFLHQLNIVSNDTNVHFHQASATDTLIAFISDNTLALQEKYLSASSGTHEALSLTLKKYIGDPAKEAVVKANLPYPATGTIDTANDPLIYSDIFLTL